MTERAKRDRLNFLLVHGAWHGAAHWGPVAAALAAAGHRSTAIDLPGCGPDAALPASYIAQDLAALSIEASPVAHVTLEDQTTAVVSALADLQAHGPVVVVAHSAGGLPVTAALEQAPEFVDRAVYVAAHCPVAFPNMLGYLAVPESAGAVLAAAFVGDAQGLGAVRINPRAADPDYQSLLRRAFYHDLDAADAWAFIARMTPDLPVRIAADEVHVTPQRWGRVPRSFIRTLHDHALPLALQDRMIADADALTPWNPFDVYSLDSGHSPIASRPEALAALLCRAS